MSKNVDLRSGGGPRVVLTFRWSRKTVVRIEPWNLSPLGTTTNWNSVRYPGTRTVQEDQEFPTDYTTPQGLQHANTHCGDQQALSTSQHPGHYSERTLKRDEKRPLWENMSIKFINISSPGGQYNVDAPCSTYMAKTSLTAWRRGGNHGQDSYWCELSLAGFWSRCITQIMVRGTEIANAGFSSSRRLKKSFSKGATSITLRLLRFVRRLYNLGSSKSRTLSEKILRT